MKFITLLKWTQLQDVHLLVKPVTSMMKARKKNKKNYDDNNNHLWLQPIIQSYSQFSFCCCCLRCCYSTHSLVFGVSGIFITIVKKEFIHFVHNFYFNVMPFSLSFRVEYKFELNCHHIKLKSWWKMMKIYFLPAQTNFAFIRFLFMHYNTNYEHYEYTRWIVEALNSRTRTLQ